MRENQRKSRKKLFAFKPSDTFQKGLPVSLYVNSLFVTFASENLPANFNKKKKVIFSPRIRHNQLEHTSGAKASRGYGCLPHIRHYNHQHNNQNQHIGYHTADLECPLFIHTDFAAEMPQTFSKHLSAVKPAKRERIEDSKEQV